MFFNNKWFNKSIDILSINGDVDIVYVSDYNIKVINIINPTYTLSGIKINHIHIKFVDIYLIKSNIGGIKSPFFIHNEILRDGNIIYYDFVNNNSIN